MIYVATPYTKYPHGRDRAALDAAKATAELLRRGYCVYSPVVHSHALCDADTGLDPVDGDFWIQTSRPIMDLCSAIVVVMLPGWQNSEGVNREIEIFRDEGKPIIYYNPGDLGMDTKPLTPGVDSRYNTPVSQALSLSPQAV